MLFGLIHVASLVILKNKGANKELYNKLKLSKPIVVLLVIMGILSGVVATGAIKETSAIIMVLKVLAVTFSVPLAILGAAWFWGVGRSLLSKPIKLKNK